MTANWKIIANAQFEIIPRNMRREVFRAIYANFRRNKRHLPFKEMKILYGEYFDPLFEIVIGKWDFTSRYHWQTFKEIRFDILCKKAAA